MLRSSRGVIGTRLLNLNDADGDHPEPPVQGNRPGGTRGDFSFFKNTPPSYGCRQCAIG
ncbi:hypothetical protein SBBP2_20114 [Burkholderiales bacterium]|nr:hypothetical protein SBBP2_20114 [Burkholderiales bacterium]